MSPSSVWPALTLSLALWGVGCEATDKAAGERDTGAVTASGSDGDDGSGEPSDPDNDNDGVPASVDCDDADPDVHPGGTEICDGKDNDCNGTIDGEEAEDAETWYADVDGDGHGDLEAETTTCEPPAEHVQNNDDCDDTDGDRFPGAPELCNGIDDDCDALIDDEDDNLAESEGSVFYRDTDGDGFGETSDNTQACLQPEGFAAALGDCDDSRPEVHPGALETCNGWDDDCDELIDDADADVDLGTTRSWYADADGDGHGDPDDSTVSCAPPSGHVADGDDCNDLNPSISPSATEICDRGNVDEDCDGVYDDNDSSTDPATMTEWAPDADTDGYGDAAATPSLFCDDPSTAADMWVTDLTDCDDAAAAIHPGAQEVCDDADIDEDCDGLSDDDDSSVDSSTRSLWYPDGDGDGSGDQSDPGSLFCNDPTDATTTWLADNTDCDDTDSAINPSATEICDAADIDEDCNGLADDEDSNADSATRTSFYPDADNDGYGDALATATDLCDDPSDADLAWLTTQLDCNDDDSSINPAATEVCDDNDTDEDCDGLTDDRDASVDPATLVDWYRDADEDGFGDGTRTPTSVCNDPTTASVTYAADDTDCDDTDSAIHPAATEVCDGVGIDEDCDGLINDDDSSLDTSTQDPWYPDVDTDGYGDLTATATMACVDPSTRFLLYISDHTDCDDTLASVNPGETEVCDAGDVDENCNGLSDDADSTVDGSTQQSWVPDQDGDGYGDAAAVATVSCEDPSTGALAWLTDNTDCDDDDDTINPGATEVCNGWDDDCDSGTTEANLATGFSSSGAATDLSASLGAGTASSPATVSLAGHAEVNICAGIWYTALTLDPSATLRGLGGASSVILDGGGLVQVLSAGVSSLVEDLTLQSGAATHGGCVEVADNVAFTGVTFTDCNATSTGGVAALVGVSGVSFDTCVFDQNSAGTFGGAIYADDSDATLADCAFAGNDAEWGGAIAWSQSRELAITSSSFDSNYATQDGGALYCGDLDATAVELTDSTLSNNTAAVGSGGGIYASVCAFDILDSTISGGLATADGGGLAIVGSDLTTDGLVLSSNTAGGNGGGAYLDRANFTDMVGGACSSNTATKKGGGLYITGSVSAGLRATAVDFSSNVSSAVHNGDNSTNYSYGTAASFTCGPTGCL